MIERGRLGWRGELSGVDEIRRAVDTYAIVDSEPWKARRWWKLIGRWMELEMLPLETGIEIAWWTYGMGVGVDIYGRDEGDAGDKEVSNLWRGSDAKGQRCCGKPVHDVI